jgi:hypothetical protein
VTRGHIAAEDSAAQFLYQFLGDLSAFGGILRSLRT